MGTQQAEVVIEGEINVDDKIQQDPVPIYIGIRRAVRSGWPNRLPQAIPEPDGPGTGGRGAGTMIPADRGGRHRPQP